MKNERDASADGQPHYWRLQAYERYVSKGVCDCGAVKFFANSNSKLALQRAEELTREKGKKGYGHEISVPAGIVDSPEKKEEITVSKEEAGEQQPIAVKAGDGEESLTDSILPLPAVPTRPDTSGMNTWHRNMAISAYFKDNKEAILHDLDTLGEKVMRERWGISHATWGSGKGRTGLRNRWRPEVYGAPLPRAGKAAGAVTPEGDQSKPEDTEVAKGDHQEEPAAEAEPEPKPDAAAEEERVYNCPQCPAKFAKGDDLWDHIKLHFEAILPHYPAFDPKWKKEVQVEWLRSYPKMAAMANKGLG